MVRHIFVLDRSTLAKNVYGMVLSKIDEVEITEGMKKGDEMVLPEKAAKYDLMVISSNCLAEKKDVVLAELRKRPPAEVPPVVLMVEEGTKDDWSKFLLLKRTVIIERPFRPDDLLEIVKKLWGK